MEKSTFFYAFPYERVHWEKGFCLPIFTVKAAPYKKARQDTSIDLTVYRPELEGRVYSDYSDHSQGRFGGQIVREACW